MPGTKPEIDQLARAAFHILGSRAVVEYEQGVGAREVEAGHPQLGLDLMLLTRDNVDVRVAVHEAGVSFVIDKSGA